MTLLTKFFIVINKQIDSMYLWICSAEEHSKHQMMEGTSVASSASAPRVPLFCSHHILTPSMIIGTLLFGFTNIKHRQELFFLAGWVEMGQFVYLMVSFLSLKKSMAFKKLKYCRKTEKP